MSENRADLFGVYVDGETKTGKGAASVHISDVLQQRGLQVYYDVAGDFYRRYAAVVRQDMGLGEEDILLPGPDLEFAAQQVYDDGRIPFERSEEFGDLQRPAIGESVSVLGKLEVAQKAGDEWWHVTVTNAWQSGADVLVVDARNPRARLAEQNLDGIRLVPVLDLFMVCSPRVAAQRSLWSSGIAKPTSAQIHAEVINVMNRRELDRKREVNPFQVPDISEEFIPGGMQAINVIAKSWTPHDGADSPVSILLDNSLITKDVMLAAVADLAAAALDYQVASVKAA